MTFSVVNTVLTSTFVTTLLVCILYFVRRHLRPHIDRNCDESAPTSPRRIGNTDPQLRETLYSLPSLNFIDPRNSIADCDLSSSRWSTNILDLSPPQSPHRTSLSRSPRMHFRRNSVHRTPSHSRRGSSLKPLILVENLHRSHSSKDADMMERSACPAQNRISQLTVPPKDFRTYRREKRYSRFRSNSDSAVYMQSRILARSHAMLNNNASPLTDPSPTFSTFSGTTLLSGPMTPHRYGARSQIRRISEMRIPASEPRMRMVESELLNENLHRRLPRTTHLTSSELREVS